MLLDEESVEREMLLIRQRFRRAKFIGGLAADWAKPMHTRCLFRKPTNLQIILCLEDESYTMTARISPHRRFESLPVRPFIFALREDTFVSASLDLPCVHELTSPLLRYECNQCNVHARMRASLPSHL